MPAYGTAGATLARIETGEGRDLTCMVKTGEVGQFRQEQGRSQATNARNAGEQRARLFEVWMLVDMGMHLLFQVINLMLKKGDMRNQCVVDGVLGGTGG